MTKKQKLEFGAMTREDIAEHVGEYTRAKIHLDRLTAGMNKELDAIRARFAEQIEAAQKNAQTHHDIVEAWAEVNKAEFDKVRSIDFARGVVGYRLGTFKVTTTKGVTFKDAIKLLLRLPWGKQFVRIKEELDREAIIANREKLTAQQMAKAGIAIEQEDRFYLEPKADEPAAVGA